MLVIATLHLLTLVIVSLATIKMLLKILVISRNPSSENTTYTDTTKLLLKTLVIVAHVTMTMLLQILVIHHLFITMKNDTT